MSSLHFFTFKLITRLLSPPKKQTPTLYWRNEGTHLELTDGARTYATVDTLNNSVLPDAVYFAFIGDHIGNMFTVRQEAQDWAITEVRHLLLQETA